jgi:hypothetical protein
MVHGDDPGAIPDLVGFDPTVLGVERARVEGP